MELQVQLCAHLHADPGALVGWLHTLANTYAVELPWPMIFVVGPHTFITDAPTPYETLGLYVVNERMGQDILARKIAVAVTYLPLRQSGIGLDLRVWPSFPATLDALTSLFLTHFAQANPVLSSVAALHTHLGAPPLACNRWVLEQMSNPAFADTESAKQLYPAWLEQYRALRGDYPADPRRAFRALLARHRRNQTRKE